MQTKTSSSLNLFIINVFSQVCNFPAYLNVAQVAAVQPREQYVEAHVRFIWRFRQLLAGILQLLDQLGNDLVDVPYYAIVCDPEDGG